MGSMERRKKGKMMCIGACGFGNSGQRVPIEC